jgi:hypothetical protein
MLIKIGELFVVESRRVLSAMCGGSIRSLAEHSTKGTLLLHDPWYWMPQHMWSSCFYYICSLCIHAICSLDYKASNERMTVNNELERMWKEAVLS